MRRLALVSLLLPLLLPGCGDDGGGHDDPPAPDAAVPFEKCTGSDESFVRNASLALIGRRPLAEGEVDVYAQLLRAVKAKDKAAGLPDDPQHARRVVARALMQSPEYTARWERHFMDKLRVIRRDDQEMSGCYGNAMRQADDGALARAVLATPAKTAVSGGDFTMRDLLRSSIIADDITPAYRGNLFALVTRPIPAANVPPPEAEQARREDFGNTFDAVYLNRDMVCLGCHNSEASTTDRDDPKLDRFWPVPGLFEKAIYGASIGGDPRQAHAMFRYDGVQGDLRPWGWSGDCGAFNPDPAPDDAMINAHFASVHGLTATVFDAEAALAHGFQVLRDDGLTLSASKEIADPDVAFAYLVAMNIVDGVWAEVTGNSLVIANYFPRNEASRDVLQLLTEKFVASGFSLQALLEEIVAGPYFDRLPPAAGCGTGPYNMPAVYDPWVISDAVEERRGNGAGDGVHALSTRTAAHAAYQALGWQTSGVQDFPAFGFCDQSECPDLTFTCETLHACCAEKHNYCDLGLPRPDEMSLDDELAFQSGTGMFLKNAERGFRGLEFQARLEWEHRFGQCTAPRSLGGGAMPDFIDGLVTRASAATTPVTLRDVVVALKDRLLSDPQVADAGEQAALEAMLGAGLDSQAAATAELETKLRSVCGAMVSSPEFLLGGQSPQLAAPAPVLTPSEAGFATVCAAVAGRKLPENLAITCGDGSLTIN